MLHVLLPILASAAPESIPNQPQLPPVPVILDTDIGDDIDDTWALAMVLGTPQLDLKLITTATNDTTQKARLVAKYLERVGRTDIPIGIGVKTSGNPTQQDAWIDGYSLDSYDGVVHEDGVGALVDMLQQAEEPMTLLVIGPQTNIQAALERDPAIARKARLVSMAGSVRIGYGGQPGAAPEYNILTDIPAARAVFEAPWPITMATLDSCGLLRLTGAAYQRVTASGEPRAVATLENYAVWTNRDNHPPEASSILFDTAAVYMAYDESLLEMTEERLTIADDGSTPASEDGRPVRYATGWKDVDRFYDLLVNTVTDE
jgi:inosine-uridine nucleoside N-ribohydrolase